MALAHATIDICSAKPKGLPLPVCVYRNPNVHDEAKPSSETAEQVPDSTNPRVWELSQANGRFALSLFKQLAKDKGAEGNIFMSPLSISTAFAMTKLGACNSTLEQIMKVDSCPLLELVSANRLFGEKSLTFNENYQNISEIVYGAKLLPLHFKEKPEMSRQKINAWVSEKTKGKINETLPEGSIDSTTILVLVNTIYFKGQWKKKFDKADVTELPFHVSEKEKCPVPMMYQETKFQYQRFPEDGVKVLELPYNGGGISMVLVLPTENTKLSETQLTLKKLSGWLNATTETTVAVQIPRFRIEDSFSLKDKMEAMGLHHLFSAEHSSLPGMVANFTKGLYVSEAYHKAFLEVNEEGSEAAGATALAFLGRSLNLNRESFVANRPFLLFIREFTINAIIFAGRVANPCKSS
uniref:Serpin domain-containing protein n=1 Tax=Electrophorus electricus TaxID=8005 RepID=A0A4W4G410_ELEEL